jgi:hypothetical protein
MEGSKLQEFTEFVQNDDDSVRLAGITQVANSFVKQSDLFRPILRLAADGRSQAGNQLRRFASRTL